MSKVLHLYIFLFWNQIETLLKKKKSKGHQKLVTALKKGGKEG